MAGGLPAATLAYSAVGFGSHHWEAVDTGGTRWFVTVDELSSKQLTIDEPLQRALGRLRASLAVAQDLSDSGLAFVVAPVKISAGEPLTRRLTSQISPPVPGRAQDRPRPGPGRAQDRPPRGRGCRRPGLTPRTRPGPADGAAAAGGLA